MSEYLRQFMQRATGCLLSVRAGDVFDAGVHFAAAAEVAIFLHEPEKERAFTMLGALRLVCEAKQRKRAWCAFCDAPLTSEETHSCDECTIVVLDSLVAVGRGWAKVAGKAKTDELVKRRRRASKRVEKRYSSFLRKGWTSESHQVASDDGAKP